MSRVEFWSSNSAEISYEIVCWSSRVPFLIWNVFFIDRNRSNVKHKKETEDKNENKKRLKKRTANRQIHKTVQLNAFNLQNVVQV